MLDINLIRQNPELVRERLARKGFEADFSEFLEIDIARRRLIQETEKLKAEKNKASAEIPRLKKEGKDTSEIMARMKQVSEQTRQIDEQLTDLNNRQQDFLDSLPNLPAEDVIAGGKENNEVIRVFGSKPEFDFTPKHHVDIVEDLGIID